MVSSYCVLAVVTIIRYCRQEYNSPLKTLLDRCCRLVARYYSLHTTSYTKGIMFALIYKHYVNSTVIEMEEGEISPDIWFPDATDDDVLEKYAQGMGM